MVKTRAARRAAAERQFLELPADVLSLVLYQLPLAHDIAIAGLTCRALCDAAKLTFKARPYSGEVVTLGGHARCVTGMAVASDGCVITGAFDGAVNFWQGGNCVRTVQADGQWISLLAVEGGARIISGSYNRLVKLWTLDGALERTFEVRCGVMAVAAMPDGLRFVVGTSDTVELHHVDGSHVRTFKKYNTHEDWVCSVAVTRDGQHIISGSSTGLIHVWVIATGVSVRWSSGSNAAILALATTPDGQRFLSGSGDTVVKVWLLDKFGSLESTFSELHAGAVNALVALPDNQHALSGSTDKTVKLFNINDGAVLRTFKHHAHSVRCLLLLPDGLRFVSGATESTARIAYHGLAP
jgi:WD40 repeat protein